MAAIMVVLYHAAAYLQIMRNESWGNEHVPGWFGAVGVGLFFALSGYLMSRIMTSTSFQDFILHRIIRIYPTFFLVTVLFVASGSITGVSPALDWRAFTLMPSGLVPYPLGVEWTLVFEIFFYVFVASLILFKKQNEAISCLLIWLLVTSLHNIHRPDNPAINVFHPFEMPFVSLNVAFAMGMLFPLVFRSNIPHPIIAVLVGLNTFYIGAYFGVVPVRWGIGLGAGLIVLSLASWSPKLSFPGQRFCNWIGNKGGSYTYALYLVHVPIIRTVYAHAGQLDPRISFAFVVLLSILISIPLGELDTAIYRYLRKRSDRSSSLTKGILAFSFVGTFVIYYLISGLDVA